MESNYSYRPDSSPADSSARSSQTSNSLGGSDRLGHGFTQFIINAIAKILKKTFSYFSKKTEGRNCFGIRSSIPGRKLEYQSISPTPGSFGRLSQTSQPPTKVNAEYLAQKTGTHRAIIHLVWGNNDDFVYISRNSLRWTEFVIDSVTNFYYLASFNFYESFSQFLCQLQITRMG